MYSNLQKSNRRTINLHQVQEIERQEPVVVVPPTKASSQLQLPLKTTIELQRNRLRTLDKTTAKSIVSAAEKSLMHLLKAKAQVSCLVPKNQPHPFHTSISLALPNQTKLFNQELLRQEINRHQKYQSSNRHQSEPLIEICRRAFAQRKQILVKPKESKVKPINSRPYCGLIEQHKRANKFLL